MRLKHHPENQTRSLLAKWRSRERACVTMITVFLTTILPFSWDIVHSELPLGESDAAAVAPGLRRSYDRSRGAIYNR